MRENERPASHANAEVATALKALLIVLLSTVLLPHVVPLPLSMEKEERGREGKPPQTLQESIHQLEIFLPGQNTHQLPWLDELRAFRL